MEFWNWLVGGAGAAWIAGIAAVITLVYSYIQRTKSPIIIIQEIAQQEMLSIHPSRKENLKVTYKDQTGKEYFVQDLIQKEVVIYNSGSHNILDTVEFSLKIDDLSPNKEKALFEIIFDDNECKYQKTIGESEKQIKALISIPYLNAFSPHKHYHRAFLLSDSNIDVTLETGMGKGWSCRYISLRQIETIFSKYEKILRFVQIGVSTLFLITMATLNPSMMFALRTEPYYLVLSIPAGEKIDTKLLFTSSALSTVFIVLFVGLLLMAIFSFFKKQIIYNLYLKCLSPLKFVEKKT